MKWTLSKQIRLLGDENYGIRNLEFNIMFERYI